ncbi:hypothetical protein Enr8_19920 [Blastopirellula retiformator]|uniref:Uncharacterized protein n=1 Tax=Blastopirellula retiformator TaxID=2527970 RepID=A0A5C5V8G8_9BACT|nr:hypothetical protein Enr8_19920 [Blastopirellula retiformator]
MRLGRIPVRPNAPYLEKNCLPNCLDVWYKHVQACRGDVPCAFLKDRSDAGAWRRAEILPPCRLFPASGRGKSRSQESRENLRERAKNVRAVATHGETARLLLAIVVRKTPHASQPAASALSVRADRPFRAPKENSSRSSPLRSAKKQFRLVQFWGRRKKTQRSSPSRVRLDAPRTCHVAGWATRVVTQFAPPRERRNETLGQVPGAS